MSAITLLPPIAARIDAIAAPLGRVPNSGWVDNGEGRAVPDPNPRPAHALIASAMAGRTLSGAESEWVLQYLCHAHVASLGGAHVILHETKTENAP